MNAKKILIAITAAVGLFRIWVLLRKKGFREFPLYFFGFALGLLLVVASINRYQAGDISGYVAEHSAGHWYQDVGVGIAFMLVAISGTWACLARGPKTEEPVIFSPEDWERFDAELSPDAPTPPPTLEETRGIRDSGETICVLHSFDTELVNRISEELGAREIAFNRVPIAEESGLEAWELAVGPIDQSSAVAVINEIEQPYRIETSNVRCEQCGSGMLVKEDEEEVEDESAAVILFICPKCKAERIVN